MDIKSYLDKDLKNTKDENMKHLTNILTAFSHVAQVPVSYFNEENQLGWECLPELKICNLFPDHSCCNKQCINTLSLSLSIASDLGEPYIFLCDAGLIKIAYPFTVNRTPRGGFFAGPISMGEGRDNTIKHLVKTLPKDEKYTAKIISYLSRMKISKPTEVSYIYDVFCNSVFSARILEKDYGLIHSNTESSLTGSSSDNEEEQLIHALKSGNGKDALDYFRMFYEKKYIVEAGNLSMVKVHLMKLFTVLSKSITGSNALPSYFLEDLELLHNAFTFSKTFTLSNNLIKNLTKLGSFNLYTGTSVIIGKAVDYINEFYSKSLTLASTAKAMHTNSSYLSSLFKKEMGISFSQYLTQVRLNYSMKLLAETHLSMTEIGMNAGFSEQSYFTKVFKDIIGMTPSQYRKRQNSFTLTP
ncbi:MAG: helix-turn-helix domain-containing protein [Anaerovoracaceae bacterium]